MRQRLRENDPAEEGGCAVSGLASDIGLLDLRFAAQNPVSYRWNTVVGVRPVVPAPLGGGARRQIVVPSGITAFLGITTMPSRMT